MRGRAQRVVNTMNTDVKSEAFRQHADPDVSRRPASQPASKSVPACLCRHACLLLPALGLASPSLSLLSVNLGLSLSLTPQPPRALQFVPPPKPEGWEAERRNEAEAKEALEAKRRAAPGRARKVQKGSRADPESIADPAGGAEGRRDL